ncbi:tRNA (adenosine(37)-N6)-threonylcarbamoyltransferase complex dimerization subunit type 1 TsaB [Fredinandcohnia quinoae]|uniref:tRNA (Adenosine(37)-N6)-threonylcarbamoyltransferase complex dimerization subunit type 1 TsaB n=1 Tax=Fredinandcohnia quinoae TaxID=2918902 RepID=A0AAW5EF72_9BACI|nr:tRNA (adenosine(37)-N6)-threonylcarbamoyltransferase complex dimerization subunit type 1 TsaB [Fredinandcohnia sp. SECRCQ15]MCH1627444.1 tRNA (adenosine(37)-N6)-threonylcarbamoyltransferase complex dimerization subunit type 1 TsaB [Fredinandcohnia sp. SECRCQ15]
MKVLSIDTSNNVMGIGLLDGEKVVGEIITNLAKNHSIRVMPAIEQLLLECGLKVNELDKIVVAKGPGSYTGVRIGVTIAKSLAWALNIPLVGISSLEALAANGRFFNGFISPIFDARRGQVYTGLYAYTDGRLICKKEDKILLLVDWLNELRESATPTLFLGNDLPIHQEIIQNELGELATFAAYTDWNPRPGELAMLGMNKEAEDVHTFVPNYIRLAEAEANWIAKRQG